MAPLISAPRVRTVRGFTDFGVSFVYVIFEDGTDIYWASTLPDIRCQPWGLPRR